MPDEPGISYIDYPTLTVTTKKGDVMVLYPIVSLQVSIEGIPSTPVESLREDVQLHELLYSCIIAATG